MIDRNILIIDDEEDMLQLLKRSLESELTCQVTTATSAEIAMTCFHPNQYDLVLTDIRMPGKNGMDLLAEIKQIRPEQTVILMTAYGGIDLAVEAMKHGAYDFITKPFDLDTLLVRIEKALERSHLVRENALLQQECRCHEVFSDMVGQSQAMLRVFETIHMIAPTDLTVLITGESGTGKELTARAVHAASDRKDAPFIPVNCPTLPEQILESELFGYKKGAFTNAHQDKPGLFEEAQGGTLFLDEIGDISPAIQTKLLRALQEKEIKPLGANRPLKVDVRIVTSTNRDLEQKIRDGSFREDLFYRLAVLPVKLPPLRERVEDIPSIAQYLLEKHCKKLKKHGKRISPDLMKRLTVHPWEGNVRELENAIIQGILFSTTPEIEPDDVLLSGPKPVGPCSAALTQANYKEAKEEALKGFNHTYIGRLLKRNQGNVSKAARACGLERQALQQIMKRYGISAAPYRPGTGCDGGQPH